MTKIRKEQLTDSLPKDLNLTGQTQGSVTYFDGSNWVVLNPSTDGYVLTTHDVSENPTWKALTTISLTSVIPVAIDKSTALVGTSLFAAKADHKHDVSTASATSIGTTNAEGSATSLARSDHTHAVTGLSITSQAQGDVLFYNGSNWGRLAASSDGYILSTHSVSQNPTWVNPNPDIITDGYTARTLSLTDQSNIIRFTSSLSISVTIPTNASVAFKIGSSVIMRQAGTGQITLVPIAGVTLNTSSSLISARQHATIAITKVNTNEWDVTGERV